MIAENLESWVDKTQQKIVAVITISFGGYVGWGILEGASKGRLVEAVFLTALVLVGLPLVLLSIWPLKVRNDIIYLPLRRFSVRRRALQFNQLREVKVEPSYPNDSMHYVFPIYVEVHATDLQGNRYRGFVWRDSALSLIEILKRKVSENVLRIHPRLLKAKLNSGG